MKNWKTAVVSLAAGVFLLLAAVGAERVCCGEPYRLGVALGFTGTGAMYSKDGRDAIKLAVDEINSQGGFLGKHPIELFIKDTRTDPKVAVEVVTALIGTDRVRTVLGTYSSGTALPIKPICRDAKVLHIAAISNSEDITRLQFSPYTYSVVPNSYMQAKAVALGVARLAKDKGWITYCTIASDYEWGRSMQENTVKFLDKLSPRLRLIRAFWPPLGEKRYDGFIMAALAYRPDCLIGSLASEDNAEWLRQAARYELFRRVPYPGSLISVSELIIEKDVIPRGVIGLTRAPFFAHLDVPMMARFIESFRARYNRYPSDWAVLEYDAVYALKQGIEKAGTIDTEKVKDAMK